MEKGILYWLIQSSEEELIDELFKQKVFRDEVPCDQTLCKGHVHFEKAIDRCWLRCNVCKYKFSVRSGTVFLGK